MVWKKLGIIFGIMLAFSLVSVCLVSAFGKRQPERAEDGLLVAASFYPVWIITENVCAGVEGVYAVNLTQNHSGCLHDYQLTTADMLTLENADILVINGGDMELFVEEIAGKLPDLRVINTCRDIVLLEGSGHSHEHGEEYRPSPTRTISLPEDAANDSGHDGNGHVWMDPARYRQQIQAAADALGAADPAHAAQYAENAERYCGEVSALWEEYREALAALRGTEVVLFHDAFYYLCDACGMEVLHGVDMDADTALSAGEIAELTDEVRYHGVKYFLAEESGRAAAEQLAAETGARVIYLNPLTEGSGTADSYLKGMRENLELLSGLADKEGGW